MKLKIGLTGPSGSGKTTLANHIAKSHGVPFMAGSAGIAMHPNDVQMLADKYGYKGEGHKAVIQKSNIDPDFGYDFQKALVDQRALTLLTTDTFVTDRTPLDNLSYFLLQCSHNQSEATCVKFVGKAINAMIEGLTHLIIIKPNDSWTEENGSRVANNFYQHMTYSVFYGTYERYFLKALAEVNIPVLILDYWDWDKRTEEVDTFLLTENV